MDQPSLDKMMTQVDSKYSLVVAAAKRARALTDGGQLLPGGKGIKPVTIALHEVAEGKVKISRSKQIPTDEGSGY
jgi:DNA-directed RNA polymerase subunit omega